MPKSKLSHRVAQLEKRLGVRLIHRSTRNVAVTELGQAYYEHCAAMLLEAEAAQETTDRSIAEPRGLFALRVRFPPLEDSELNGRVLSRSPQPLMAAPSLFEQHPQPAVPGDLNGLPSLDWA